MRLRHFSLTLWCKLRFEDFSNSCIRGTIKLLLMQVQRRRSAYCSPNTASIRILGVLSRWCLILEKVEPAGWLSAFDPKRWLCSGASCEVSNSAARRSGFDRRGALNTDRTTGNRVHTRKSNDDSRGSVSTPSDKPNYTQKQVIPLSSYTLGQLCTRNKMSKMKIIHQTGNQNSRAKWKHQNPLEII